MNLSNYPVVKILIPYVIGILCVYFCPFFQGNCHLWTITTLILWTICLVLWQITFYKWQWIKDGILLFSFVFAGIVVTNFHYYPLPTEGEQKLVQDRSNWKCHIIDFPVPKEKSIKIVVENLEDNPDISKNHLEKIILYVQKTSTAEDLQYGDILFVNVQLSALEPPNNPDAFNNQKYMRRKGIFYTGYVSENSWKKVGHKTPNWLKENSKKMQQRLSGIFATSGMSGQEYDIIKAILLGDDDTMEPELKAAYAAAGVSHILCVSGMHVGIIFMIIDFLLKPLDLTRSTRTIKAILLLLTIWLYANITGLSPSVTRSATMFTFVTLGSLIQRNTNIFHSLLASLFILLSINPLLLFEVGFQLSYLAVFGIVLFQPIIANIYHCKTKIGNYFWELMSVSIAAQISTFPISIYYFGQFPNYFILSNLSVIALSFIVMITGVILLGISFIPILTRWVSFLLTWEIRIMNHIITFIEELPGAVTKDIDYSNIQVLLLYLVITLLYLTIKRKKKRLGWACYAIFALFSTTFAIRKTELIQQNEVLCYSIRKEQAICFCQQQQAIYFADSIRNEKDKSYQYSIQNHARKQHAQKYFVSIDTARFDAPNIKKRGNFILSNGKTYYLLKGREKLFACNNPPEIDILILGHNPTQKPEQVWQSIHFKKVLADGSNTTYYIQRWRSYCEQNHIDFQENGKMTENKENPNYFRIFAPH